MYIYIYIYTHIHIQVVGRARTAKTRTTGRAARCPRTSARPPAAVPLHQGGQTFAPFSVMALKVSHTSG